MYKKHKIKIKIGGKCRNNTKIKEPNTEKERKKKRSRC